MMVPSVQEASMKNVEIDRGKRLKDQPATGHNRFHPDVPPLVTVAEGEEVVLATRDGVDGQLGPGTSEADMAKMEAGAIHPLTGPVFVKGARPGDMLEVEFLDIVPQPHAFTAIVPGLGFLRDLFTTPFLVHWQIRDGWATAPKLPGVRIPGAPFMGVSGVAPSAAQVRAWTARENALLARGGFVFPPDATGAVPSRGPVATEGIRTLPPRENGGNFDVKQLTKGSKLLLPVAIEGALFSTGDGHFAQGDGEVCVTAVEMGATAAVRFRVLKGTGAARAMRGPRFSHAGYFAPPEWAAPAGLRRRHGHADPGRRCERRRDPDARLPERAAQHDRSATRTGMEPRAGLRPLQRGGGSAHQQRGRRAELRRVRSHSRSHLHRLRRDQCLLRLPVQGALKD